MNRQAPFRLLLLCLTVGCLLPWSGEAEDALIWNTNKNQVSADIKSESLPRLLVQIATATGWRVFVEPDTARAVSAKFKDATPGEALRLLLGDINYALVPGTNSSPRLFVFRTSPEHATQQVQPSRAGPKNKESKVIPNELIVRLKPGAKIDELAKLLGAKVIGRIDSLNAYRLQFDDAATTTSAREQLANNPDVASIDSNYSIAGPEGPQLLPVGAPPIQLQLKPPPDNGRIIVGLVDTAVQSLGNNLDQFLMKQVSVAGDVQLSPDSPTHGTAMAETLLRSLESITKGNTSVQILPVNVYPGGGAGDAATSTFDVANGIVQAVNGGAKVINLSLGSSSDSPFLQSVIQDVSKLNVPMFAAAGNEPVTTAFYPAAYPGVKAVTAIDNGQLAPYANRGSFVSLGAPGSSIVPFGNMAFGVQGTSVSSAYTTGLAAGYLETSGNNVSKMESFLNSNFGVKLGPGK
ncbi:MAG TPA: S8 family serine peptidase [Verrucomicrobiae bacterium]|nr:S8 family serine peptidase [Verrucomicrobiae bacterium]